MKYLLKSYQSFNTDSILEFLECEQTSINVTGFFIRNNDNNIVILNGKLNRYQSFKYKNSAYMPPTTFYYALNPLTTKITYAKAFTVGLEPHFPKLIKFEDIINLGNKLYNSQELNQEFWFLNFESHNHKEYCSTVVQIIEIPKDKPIRWFEKTIGGYLYGKVITRKGRIYDSGQFTSEFTYYSKTPESIFDTTNSYKETQDVYTHLEMEISCLSKFYLLPEIDTIQHKLSTEIITILTCGKCAEQWKTFDNNINEFIHCPRCGTKGSLNAV